ncbi:B12-binding domain-containing radical SAM protein [Candidatus Omnitrophota bacterium]
MSIKQNKILLITPPFYRLYKDTHSLVRYPLSLGYLSSAVKTHTAWDVMAYNADFISKSAVVKNSYITGAGFKNYLINLKDLSKPIWKEVKSTISEYRPDVIGISTMSCNFASARIVAKLAKEIDKNIIIIAGGPHPSMVAREVLKCQDIDISVKGEGEQTLVELLKAIESKKDISSIRGISYRKNGQIFENIPREFIENLDSLSFPHETAHAVLKDYDKYPKLAFKHIFATRGCPYNCFFCGSRNIWSHKARFRSVKNVIEEIKSLQLIGLDSISFEDDTFGINKDYIVSLCKAIMADCPGLKWSCELHVKLVDEKIIALMKRSGCYSISIGIESGNNEILKKIRKNITIEEAMRACRLIKKYGIELCGFYMVGFPYETEDTLNDTISSMKEIDYDALVYSIFTPYPGTEAFEFCRQSGLIGDDYDVSLYNHQSPANCFCMNIRPERFRELLSGIEKMVDKKNSYGFTRRMKRAISFNTFKKIRKLGVARSIKKGVALLKDSI